MLTLFQTFFSEKNPSEDATTAESYSNTIELYDAIPKYIAHPRVNGAKLERDFVHRGTFIPYKSGLPILKHATGVRKVLPELPRRTRRRGTPQARL